MKSNLILTIACIVFMVHVLLLQKFTPTVEGNAVVYMVRTTSFGLAPKFRFFDGHNFVGVFKGKAYMRYELPADIQVLWVASENKRFLDCDFKPGETNLISSNHKLGVIKNHIVITHVTVDNSNFEKCKNGILENKQITRWEKKKPL